MAPTSSSVPNPGGVLAGGRVLIYSGWLSPNLWKMSFQLRRPLQRQKVGVVLSPEPGSTQQGEGVRGLPDPPWDLAFSVSWHFPKGDARAPRSRRGAFRWDLGERNCSGGFSQRAPGHGPRPRATVAQARLLRWSCLPYARPAAGLR